MTKKKKNFLIGIIVSFVVAIILCSTSKVSVPRMIYTVPVCAIFGGLSWLFFAWLADVMPFLSSWSEISSWFTNFLWTYIGKPLVGSVVVSFIIICLIGKPKFDEEKKSETETEETSMIYQKDESQKIAFNTKNLIILL